ARAAAGVRVPTVVREANTPQAAYPGWVSGRTLLAHRLAPLTYRGADGVIAVSDGVKDALVTVLGVPEGKVATLYNPVVAPELKRLAREDPCHPWFAAGEPPVVLGVGSLTPRKDFATLVRAFARLERPDARLVILGEGEERAALQALVAELGLTGRVDLPGFAQNPFAFMSRAAVFVLSSTLEGLPGALVQALACGCPAVATDCPSGPREVLRDGAVGPLVPVGDVDPLERRVEQQPGGRVDVPLPLPHVQVHGQRGLGDLAALVPGGEQREGAEVVDAGRDARPVVLAAGRDAGALAPAADVAGEAVALLVEDELRHRPRQLNHDLVVVPRGHALDVEVEDRGDHVPEVDRGDQVVLTAAHREHAARSDERGAGVRLRDAEVLERDAAQPRRLLGVGLLP